MAPADPRLDGADGAGALVARGLTVELGGRPVLEDVEVSIPAGVSVAILGPNGAGKSTLLGAAIGLIAARRGTIEIADRGIAFMPQRLEVEPGLPVTVADVVRMGRYGSLGWLRRFRALDRRMVEAAMDELGIAGLAGRPFAVLSGGERQRTLLAQAAAQDAGLLLLDEPLAGVDAPTRDRVVAAIERWRAEGRTVVMTTHDLDAARRDFDLVLCLNRRVVAFGSPADALTGDALERTFAGAVVRVGERLVGVGGHEGVD